MSVINKHIFKLQFIAIAVTFLAMGLIDFVLAVLNELNYRTNETYTASTALKYVLLTTPTRLYVYSPYITLVGVLFATGQMANDRELVVYESASLAKPKIVSKILIAPIVWLCLFFVMGETVAPYYELKAKETRDIAASKTSTQYGVWHKEGDNYYFFNAIDQLGSINGGYRITQNSDQSKIIATTFGTMALTGSGQWQANNTLSQIFTIDGIETVKSEKQLWALEATPELLLMESNSALNLSIAKLLTYTNYLEEQGLNNKHYSLKFWQKLSQPAITLALVWLGITFIFGPLRQSSMGARIFTGVMVSLVLNIIQSVLSPLSLTLNLPTVVVAITPLAGIILLNLFLLRKQQ